MYRVTLDADEAFDEELPRALERAALLTLEAEGAAAESDVTIALTGEEEMRQLNCQYREVDGVTDVLSFEMHETMPDGRTYLGDVVVCVPVAQRQADAQGHSLLAELSLLVVHGLLHLLGEDHDDAAARASMWAKQSAMLEQLGLSVSPTES